MDVSVIITTRNASTQLPAALASVIAQTSSRRLDVIVADHGSADQTPAIVQPYLDRYRNANAKVTVRYVCLGEDNLGAAYNQALQATQAPYVAFLRSVDYWDRFKLKRQLTAMHQDEAIGLVHTACRRIDAYGQFTDDGPQSLDNPCTGHCLKQLLQGNAVAFSSVLVRRSFLEQAAAVESHGRIFDPSQPKAAEYDLLLRLARLTRFVYIPHPLTLIGPAPGPNTATAEQLVQTIESNCRVLVDFIQRHGDRNGNPVAAAVEPTTHVRRFLLDRAELLLADDHPVQARRLCRLAEDLHVFDDRFAELDRRAAHSPWLSRLTQRVRRLWSGV